MPTFTWPTVDGVAGQLLATNGAAVLSWSGAAVGFAPVYRAKTGSYSALANDCVSCTANSFTVTMPAAAANPNAVILVVNNGTGTITIGRTGTDMIGLATSQTLNPATATTQGDSMVLYSDSVSNWSIN